MKLFKCQKANGEITYTDDRYLAEAIVIQGGIIIPEDLKPVEQKIKISVSTKIKKGQTNDEN